jgi:hypothetical protein
MLLRNSLVRCDLNHRTRILPRLTGNEAVIAQIESKGAQCKCEKVSDRPLRVWTPIAKAQSREGLTERAFTLPRKLRGCSWTSRKDPPLGAAIALAQDSFDRDKTR